jgi:hypothetical protein
MQNVRLTDPEDDSDDPEFFIDIPAIERMTRVRHPGAQRRIITFQPSAADPVAEERETARTVAVRRIPFCETNVDDVLDETGYLADGEDYERKLDTIDDSQHLDVEIVESYPSKVYNGPSPQDVKVSLDNSALKEAYAKPPSDAKRPPLRLDPFQNIRNVCWGAGATEIPPEATLHQLTSAVEDPAKITIAIFCYLSKDGLETVNSPELGPSGIYGATLGGMPILQFGHKPEGHLGGTDQQGNWPSYIGASFGQAYFNLTGTQNCQTSIDSSGIDLPCTPRVLNNDDAPVRPGDWNCILLSLDATQGLIHNTSVPDSTFPDGNYMTGTLRFVVNGVDCTEGVIRTESTVDGGWVDSLGNVRGPLIVGPQEQPWTIGVFGEEFALPVQTTETEAWPHQDRPKVAYGYVQVWTDQALDFSDPDIRAKFMKPDPDDPAKPRMVDPSVAQKAFGEPTFFFDGGPTKFVKNQGGGGEFTKIGDLKSFRPAPPKASAS